MSKRDFRREAEKGANLLTTLPRIVTALCFQSSSLPRAPSSRTLQHVLISRLNSASRSIPPDAAPFSILSDSDRLSKEFPPRLGQSTERARVVARLVRFFPFRLVLGETRFDRDEEKRAMVISFDIEETLLRGKYVPFFSYATIMHDTRDLSRYSAVVISVYSNF